MQHDRNCLISITVSRTDWCAPKVCHLLKPAAPLLICKSHVYCLLITSVICSFHIQYINRQWYKQPHPCWMWQDVTAKFIYIRKVDTVYALKYINWQMNKKNKIEHFYTLFLNYFILPAICHTFARSTMTFWRTIFDIFGVGIKLR